MTGLMLMGLRQTTQAQALRDDPELKKIDVQEHLGDTIPTNLQFVDHMGNKVNLNDFFHKGKPVILTLNYYRCPMLCTQELNGLAEAMMQLKDWTPGDQYQVVTISIDPTETPELADSKRYRYISSLGDLGQNAEWHFLVGDQPQIKKLADAVGFKYFYIKENKQFAHPAVIFLLSDKGVISRYLYGLSYKPRDLRLALVQAGDGKIGTTVDKLILYCCQYDPDAKGYVLFAQHVMTLGGVVTLVLMVVFLIFMFVRYKVRKVAHHSAA